MHCPNCSHKNRPEAKFCENCGTQLELKCSNCGTVNRPGAKFCDNCGNRLGGDAGVETPHVTSLRDQASEATQPIPGEFADKLTTARMTRAMLGERRIVTMLFCDVTGSTAAAEQLDPEEWREIINGAFEHMIAPIYRYEGTLARLMGDAILAFFGAPIAHEDDPHRAVLAGLEIVNGIEPYWDAIEKKWGSRLNVRIGINTGLVVVGAVGSDLKMEYTAIGDAINLASRMEQTAAPGSVQVSENTYRLAAPLFEWEALGVQEVRGRAEPVKVYQPVRKRDAPGRLRGIEGLSSPLIGRADDLQKIAGALETLRLGRGGAVFITGEAGLGKTRLLRAACIAWETGDAARARPPHWTERRATSYDALQAYSLVKGLLRTLCGIDEQSGREQVERRVTDYAADLEIPASRRADLDGALVRLLAGKPSGDEPSAQEAFKSILFDSVRSLLGAVYADRPGVIVVDDLHWADPASVELLSHLVPLVEEAALVFIFTTRPDRDSPGWSFKTDAANRLPHRFLEVDLRPLSPEDGSRLVDHLLPGHDLTGDLMSLIRTRAEGNPYFVEEIVRDLIEAGVLREQDGRWQVDRLLEQIDVPETVEALLTARLDRLSPPARDLLQAAAVIGRTFSYEVLKTVVSNKVSPDRYLAELERTQMIEETARQPELAYSFRQALTQELVYRSILRRRRKEIHAEVGKTIETLQTGRLRDAAPVLAFHFQEAGDSQRVVRYSVLAGDAAANLFANTEAIRHYDRALSLNRAALPDAVLLAPGELKDVYLRKGRVHELSSQFQEALDTYLEMEKWGETTGDRSLVLSSVVGRAVLLVTPSVLFNPERAGPLIERALDMAREIGDREAEARSLWAALGLNGFRGNLVESVEIAHQGLAIAEEEGYVELIGYLSHNLAYTYSELGEVAKSTAAFNRSAEIWEELGNLPLLADGLSGNVVNLILRGDLEQALEDSEKALEISRKTRNLWGKSFSRMNLGAIYRDYGRYAEAIEAAQKSIRDGIAAGFIAPEPMCGLQLVTIYLDLGDISSARDQSERIRAAEVGQNMAELQVFGELSSVPILIAEGKFEEAQELYRSITALPGVSDNFRWYYSDHAETRVDLALGRFKEALDSCETHLETTGRLGLVSLRAELLLFKAHCLIGIGADGNAQTVLEEARAAAERLQQRRVLWRILAALSKIATRKKDEKSADLRRVEAIDVLTYITDHAPPEQRKNFLAREDVVRVMKGRMGE